MTIAALEARMHARLGLPPGAGRSAFEAARDARLAEAVAAARTASPFYRRRTDWPDRPILSAADLSALPFTTADDLVRSDPPLVAVPGGAVERIVTLSTSGTSGLAKRLHFTVDDLEATVDFFRYGMGVFTRPGERVAFAFPSDRPGGVGAGLGAALARLGAKPLPVPADASPEETAAFLRRERADGIAGPPVTLLAAARASMTDDGPPIRLSAALVSSDHAAASLKRAIADAFGAAVHDHWGMTETGYGGAVDCPAHAGLHLREADLLVEIVDPQTGRVRPAGEAGEIVVTTLQPRATPLLRYRTGDRGRLLAGRCPCGSHLVRLGGLAGRLDGDVALGPATLTMPLLDEILFAVPGVTDFAATVVGDPVPVLRIAVAAPAPQRTRDLLAAAAAALTRSDRLGPVLDAGAARLELSLADRTVFVRTGKRRILREG